MIGMEIHSNLFCYCISDKGKKGFKTSTSTGAKFGKKNIFFLLLPKSLFVASLFQRSIHDICELGKTPPQWSVLTGSYPTHD